jgi:hypothetical protein
MRISSLPMIRKTIQMSMVVSSLTFYFIVVLSGVVGRQAFSATKVGSGLLETTLGILFLEND